MHSTALQTPSSLPAAAPSGHLVVMTACIDPSSGPTRIARMDPVLRLQDYLAALRWWLQINDPNLPALLLIENSGFPLDVFHEQVARANPHRKQFEAISLRANDYPPELDYGYAELKMLDVALPCSQLASRHRFWIKATGRLTFPGISRLIRELPSEYLFAVDSRTALPLFRQPKQLWTHTRLMLLSGDFWRRHLFDVKRLMRAGECIELMLYRVFAAFDGQPGAIRRWPIHVPARGVSGQSGRRYDTTSRRLVDAMRSISRVVAPNWWI